MKLSCIIVDDEMIARRSLQHLCQKVPSLHLVDTFEHPQDVLSFLEDNTIDLIFLDVEMPGISGIELMNQIGNLCQVILTTSKTDYAYDAFQYHVTDYLKKPIFFPRFEQAVLKAIDQHKQSGARKSNSEEIYIRVNGKYVRIAFQDILYIENAGDYVCIKTKQGSHIIPGTIKSINTRLRDPRFLKVHRSFIVNLNEIKDIEDSTLVIESKVIPVSRAHRSLLVSHLNVL